MKAFRNAAPIVLMALSVVACRMPKTLKGGEDGFTRTSELWSDVPKMEGLSPSTLEPPPLVKVLMRAALNGIGGKGEHDRGDWIVFDSNKTSDDVGSFYNNERMAANGWIKSDKSTCVSGSQYGTSEVGMVCLFGRPAGEKIVALMIIPAPADEAGKINVWFVRVEAPYDSSTNKQADDERGTGMSKTPAPYGIDQRPMPTGSKIDQLLPAHVGSYSREALRSPTSPNLKPEEIQGAIESPIYADYRAGNATIFVELGVLPSAKDAREALDAAAGDAAGGVFPTDPRFGARGQEPSYLKVVDSDGAFFAWTRGSYYFSAHAKSGEAALDAFVQAFPY